MNWRRRLADFLTPRIREAEARRIIDGALDKLPAASPLHNPAWPKPTGERVEARPTDPAPLLARPRHAATRSVQRDRTALARAARAACDRLDLDAVRFVYHPPPHKVRWLAIGEHQGEAIVTGEGWSADEAVATLHKAGEAVPAWVPDPAEPDRWAKSRSYDQGEGEP